MGARQSAPCYSPSARTLIGRFRECGAIDELLSVARSGDSGALVLYGNAGIGKTALLDYAAGAAAGFRVERVDAAECESQMPYAAAHQLCGRLTGGMDRLPAPQAYALAAAFGQSTGPAPNRFLVGLAVLGLLSEASSGRPLLCLIDNAQWLDQASAQVLAVACRRLDTEAVALIFAIRVPGRVPELTGLPELPVQGLGPADADCLLSSVLPWLLDERVRGRIVAETGGNPHALLALSRGTPNDHLAAGITFEPMPTRSKVEDSLARRIETLPAATRRLMLLAAAEPTGDRLLLWRAAKRVGITVDDADPAESQGLLRFRHKAAFAHPFIRSTVYGAASGRDRRWAHGTLALATDARADPDLLAWHRSLSVLGPDEAIAAELERSAGFAQARGGLAAAAALLERAALLTPDLETRAGRALAAAQANAAAGVPAAASELLGIAESVALDGIQAVQAKRLRAHIGYFSGRGRDLPALLLEAAARAEPLDPAMAREIYLEAFEAAVRTGQYGIGPGEVAEAAGDAPRRRAPLRAADLLLDGLVTFSRGYHGSAKALRDAARAFADAPDIRWMWIAGAVAFTLWDDDGWYALASRQAELAQETGALAVLPLALNLLARCKISMGEFADAAALIREAQNICAATGSAPLYDAQPSLACWQGDEESALKAIDASLRWGAERGDGAAITFAECASALLHNSSRRNSDALVAAERAFTHDKLAVGIVAAPEFVEAAVHCGESGRAERVLGWMTERAETSGTPWGLGIAARSRALLADESRAEDHFRKAIELLGCSRMRTDLARAHLLYGEYLRRERRLNEAREQLRTAHDMFTSMGALIFARRAAAELRAAGARMPAVAANSSGELTSQEGQIAIMAANGLSNRQIGARLFISSHTVEYHMRKIFAKLGITSRNHLPNLVMPQPSASAD